MTLVEDFILREKDTKTVVKLIILKFVLEYPQDLDDLLQLSGVRGISRQQSGRWYILCFASIVEGSYFQSS